MERVSWILLFFLLFAGAREGSGFTVTMETDLRNTLLSSNYSTTVRPSAVTQIMVGLNLIAINRVDMKNQEFSLTGWWCMFWQDDRLAWNGTTYASLPVIQVYQTEVWTPALVVDNSVSDLSAVGEKSIPMRISNTGQVVWNPPSILVTACEMDPTYFPFDTQVCAVTVTSFGYTIDEINITMPDSSVNLHFFSENGEWDLLRTWHASSEFVEAGYTYPSAIFYFELQRRTAFYGLNTMLPVLLNSFLVPVVFMLPHDSGEKIGYCLTCLLAYVVVLSMVMEGLPTNAKYMSLLGVYIAIVLIMSAVSVVLAIYSLVLFHRPESKPIPRWVARVARWILKPCASSRVATTSLPAFKKVCSSSNPSINSRACLESRSSKDRDEKGSTTSEEGEDGQPMTWQRVAEACDYFLLRLYLTIITAVSLGFCFGMVGVRF